MISSSGLKCLLDNHAPKYLTEWIIPIVIKEFDMENGNILYFFHVGIYKEGLSSFKESLTTRFFLIEFLKKLTY